MINRNSLIPVLVALLGVSAPFAAKAQSAVTEDFTGGSATNAWWFFNGACLTAGSNTGVEPTVSTSSGTTTVSANGQLPGCTTIASSYYNKSSGEVLVGGASSPASFPDPNGSGALRFTNGHPYGYSENGGIVFATPFPTGQGVSITFKTVTYLGDSGGGGGDGADGMSFFLMDASKLNTSTITGTSSGNGNGLGSWGGSLGYTCSNANGPYNGLIGAYLGLGIDEYGNFLNGATNTLSETGTSATGDNTATGGGYQPGRIGLRGAGNIAWSWLNTNYPNVYKGSFSGAQQNTAVQETCRNGVLWDEVNNRAVDANDNAVTTANQVPVNDYAAVPNGYTVLPTGTKIANESATTRGQATPILYQLKISQNGLLNFAYATCPPTSTNGCSAWTQVIRGMNILTLNGALPQNFLFGFAGSTGGSTNIHEILCFQAAPSTSAASSAGASEKQSAKLETGVQAYFAYYNPSNGWTGRVTASSLYFDSYGNVLIENTPNWDASCYLTGGNCSTTGVNGMAGQGFATPSRQMLTWNGTTGTGFEYPPAGTLDLSPAQQSVIDTGDSSVTPAMQCTLTTGYTAADRVNYLRGARTCEVNTAGVGEFRRRTSLLGDVMDSSPTWVGAPDAPYPGTWSDRIVPTDPLAENASGAVSYTNYASSNISRQNVVYVGANDGFLHAFRSGIFNPGGNGGSCASNPVPNCFSLNDGRELLAYMPGAVVQTIHQYNNSTPTAAAAAAALDYSNPQYGHNFFVDATAGTGDAFYNNGWHTLLFGGLGPGGSAIYALDITDPTQFTEGHAPTLVIGEWTGATVQTTTTTSGTTTTTTSTIAAGTMVCTNVPNCDRSLGNTYGTPQIRRLHDGNWAVIFGNGFGSVTGDAGIYVGVITSVSSSGLPQLTFYYLSTNTGIVSSSCTGTSCGGCSVSACNGIAFVTPADLDGDHITDYVYAGDLQGNVWKFDLTSATEANWAVMTPALFHTINTGCSTAPLTPPCQPITTQVVVASGSPSPGMQQQLMIMFGTGQKTPLTNTTGVSYAGAAQNIYGVWDWNMSSWNSQSSAVYASLPAGTVGTLTQSNLVHQVVTISTYTVPVPGSTSGATEQVQNRDIMSNANVCWPGGTGCTGSAAQYGWWLNLPGTQEQIIYNPELAQQALTVNSIVPATNLATSCTQNNDTGFTYAINTMNGQAFYQAFLPPSAAAAGLSSNPAYADTHAVALQTDATGSSFITSNSAGTQFLIFETNQVEGGGGATSNNLQGGTLGLNLPPNTIGHRVSWIERR